MTITNQLATSNAIRVDGVNFFSSFPGKPNHLLAHRLTLATRRVQTCCYGETSLKPMTHVTMHETETISVSDGVGIVRFLKGKSYLVTGATGFLAKGKRNPKTDSLFFVQLN